MTCSSFTLGFFLVAHFVLVPNTTIAARRRDADQPSIHHDAAAQLARHFEESRPGIARQPYRSPPIDLLAKALGLGISADALTGKDRSAVMELVRESNLQYLRENSAECVRILTSYGFNVSADHVADAYPRFEWAPHVGGIPPSVLESEATFRADYAIIKGWESRHAVPTQLPRIDMLTQGMLSLMYTGRRGTALSAQGYGGLVLDNVRVEITGIAQPRKPQFLGVTSRVKSKPLQAKVIDHDDTLRAQHPGFQFRDRVLLKDAKDEPRIFHVYPSKLTLH